ncbi:hypothetical protein [Paenibacillus sp. MMO-177]|uniref:hypothetical protein n=1 Tax=Paenibacillus sp. MMO-177 TaxID=3081289 RepID=UPI003017294E
MDLESLLRQAKPDYPNSDSNKVTSAILQRLQETPKIQRCKRSVMLKVVSAVIIAMMLSAITVNAASGGKLFGAIILNKENKHIANEPNYATYEPVGTEIESNKEPLLKNKIINKDQLPTISASSITNIAVKEEHGKYLIPTLLLTNNADLVIFTKQNESGWNLKKGEKLTLRFTLDLKTSKYSDQEGEWIQSGYIKNGELIAINEKKDKEFSSTITADEAGEFYFYIENFSAGKVIIESGLIE